MIAGVTAVPYLPLEPRRYRPGIGLIGCGGISALHLAAYRAAGYDVLALCDLELARALDRQAEYFPAAKVGTDYRELLAMPDLEVVDIATHVDVRPPIVEAALRAGKHVLSQKPFVRSLAEGRRLCAVADEVGRTLAVNQNGRWAPHFSYLRTAVAEGRIGALTSADFAVYWPHDRIVALDPHFATMDDLILYDFGIHWFDLVATLFAGHGPARSVTAQRGTRPGQVIPVATQAQVLIDFDGAQASLLFRGASPWTESGGYRVEGTSGALIHAGLSLGGPDIVLVDAAGAHPATVEGSWFANGMRGTMGELLRAIEEGRRPSIEGRASLPGLALCYAAIESSRTGRPVDPATVDALPQ
jgi:predicted dehydrogenase